MDYDAVLEQVVALLQREKRLAYRVLKRRFQLDDDLLEDLKDDLIYAKKLAVDEEGKVLVWAGGASAPSAPAPTPPEPAQPQSQPAHASEGAASRCGPACTGSGAPPAHGAVLRSGRLDGAGQPVGSGRAARRDPGVSSDVCRGDPAL